MNLMLFAILSFLMCSVLVQAQLIEQVWNQPCLTMPSEECSRFYVRGDFLYWHSCEEGLAIAVRTNEPLFDETFTESSEKMRPFKEDWEIGFKLGLGFDAACDYDLDLTWTFFEPEINRSAKADPEKDLYLIPFTGYVLAAPLNVEGSKPRGDRVKGTWDLEFHTIDFGVGKKLCFAEGLILFRPHIDLRYLCLNQRLCLETEGTLITDDQGTSKGEFTYESLLRNDNWGFGPRIGFDLGLSLDCHWGLYGSFASSLVYGERCLRDRERVHIDCADEVKECIADQKTKRSFRQRCTTPIIDLGAGFYWSTLVGHGECCYQMIFKAGWEQRYFIGEEVTSGARNLAQILSQVRDLSTQGLTITLAIGF